ncbi:hypothetical protein [Vibrio barjaei]|uniref:hypothetical protein n=1 Tax=Vibrio barjaei TaxID=1676683 RepID=UPI00228460FD|nr:hypothetical protein [Vibrio barjaei]MCY9873001.1 hypothetical protein [Vibrio barjaei]
MKALKLSLALMCSAASAMVGATERNDIPSCTKNVPSEYYQLPQERELFLMIDRTMVAALDDETKASIYNNVGRFLRPGDKLQMIEFSSFQGGAYTKVSFVGQMDSMVDSSVQNYVKKSVLRDLDSCLKKQKKYTMAMVGKGLKQAFTPMEAAPNTELLGGLRDIGNELVSASSANRKVLVLVSDMLENSDVTTFYRSGNTRVIEPSIELNKVRDSFMMTDFSQADVYVIGTGLIEGKTKYVSAKKMNSYESFWRAYFKESGATVRGFGKPMLLTDFK